MAGGAPGAQGGWGEGRGEGVPGCLRVCDIGPRPETSPSAPQPKSALGDANQLLEGMGRGKWPCWEGWEGGSVRISYDVTRDAQSCSLDTFLSEGGMACLGQ